MDGFNIKEQVTVTEEGLQNAKPGYMYDPGLIEDDDEATANLPEINVLLAQVIKILDYMSQNEIKQMRKDNEPAYQSHMEQQFPNFSMRYYGVFQKLISGEDLNPLFQMMGQIERVKRGEISLSEAEKEVGESLAEKYVYPHVGHPSDQ